MTWCCVRTTSLLRSLPPPAGRCEAETRSRALCSRPSGRAAPGPRHEIRSPLCPELQAQARAQDAGPGRPQSGFVGSGAKGPLKASVGGAAGAGPADCSAPDRLAAVRRDLVLQDNRGGPSKRGCGAALPDARPRAGLAPHPLFDPDYFGGQHAASIGTRDPLVLYLAKRSSRSASPHPLFDLEAYVERVPAAMRHPLGPLGHYIDIGAADGVPPNAWYVPDPEREPGGLIGWIEARATEWVNRRRAPPIPEPHAPVGAAAMSDRPERPLDRGQEAAAGSPRVSIILRGGRRRVTRAGDGGIRSAPDDPGLGAARRPRRK